MTCMHDRIMLNLNILCKKESKFLNTHLYFKDSTPNKMRNMTKKAEIMASVYSTRVAVKQIDMGIISNNKVVV